MKHFYTLILSLLVFGSLVGEQITYPDSWGNEGFTLLEQNRNSVRINYSIKTWSAIDTQINGVSMQEISMPGTFLPNDEGSPNLPGSGRFIAVPQGATPELKIVSFRTETFENIDMMPAPRIPWANEDGPLEYNKDMAIYSADQFYPAQPIKLSGMDQIRGVDVVMLGITPFQYNPMTRQLLVYRDIEVEITFKGGSDHFGEDRLRSRWWDPMLSDILLNYESLAKVDYNKSYQAMDDVGCEYLVITPTGPDFQQWADSIRNFRTLQGIQTMVVTLDEIGGNNANTIENYINNAYNTWDIVPSAILLLGDYGTNATNSVISPIYNNYCVSDNIYGDIDGNHMPDIITARMTANNAAQLETMVTKFINYERNPPTEPDFYDHPITALGFQTERWFQICTESVAGYWENVLGKSPQRENAIYSGTPGSSWSSANNTYTVVNYFGPNGLGYIPSAPTGINCSWDASATSVVDALNSGGFILLHRDHGAETLWGEPDFSNSDVDDLTNSDLSYIWSVNCLTGKYNYGGECLVEKLHRHTYGGQNAGALGAIGDSEVSYSFVNDTYVWGAFDFMWPDFMPDYGSTPEPRGIMPSFANAAGKYFLQASSWPYNEDNKEVTFNLFHHHGDGFLTLYSEVPQSLTVLHNGQLLAGNNSFEVAADEGSLIALTVDGEIIATAVGTGEPLEISIPPQQEGSQMFVAVTMQNFYRHQSMVDVISSNIAYVIKDDYEMNEVAGNGNGLMDYGETISLSVTMENIGTVAAVNVVVNLTSDNSFIAITDNTENFGNMQPGSIVSIEDCFQFEVDHLIPDNENIFFNLEATDGTDTWVSQIVIKSHAPVLEFMGFEISDPAGNNNGRIDPGETADIMITVENSGSSDAMNVLGEMGSSDPFIILNTTSQNYGFLNAGSQAHKTYSVTAVASTPEGHQVDYLFDITCDGGIQINTGFYTVIGKYTALVLDLDPQNFSGPGIYETFENMEITAVYETTFPEDLGIYKNIFISLGIQFQNYELSLEEGQELKDFLLEGGNIYMEGRSTWKTDQQTEVHPMFNIDVEDVYTFIIQNIKGVDGTFTAGMLFDFDGVNPINNYSIESVGSAFGILTVGDQEYGCGVANDAGTYKTIASTIEFGRLVDNEPPSTRIELMQQYLDWFNGVVTGTEDGISKINPSQFEISPNPFNQNTSVQFSLEQENDVTIKIHNLQGQPVKTIIEKSKLNPGIHRMSWDGTSNQGEKLNSGIYFIIFQSGNKQIIHKIILTK